MAILDGLRRVFRSDAFIPTNEVFPNIDDDRIARELRLDERGREQGRKNLPASGNAQRDAVEQEIVSRIEELRRKGLQNYENNKDIYAKRLSRASAASLEVQSVAGKARGDFESEVKDFRGQMTGDLKNLKEWNTALEAFRRKNGLDRPAYASASWFKTAAILLGCVLLETVLNGYLFAQKNELGLLGGALVALLVALLNVTGSSLGGLGARFIRHRSIGLKLGGASAFLGWVVLLFAVNLAVAHFRDSIETLSGWSQAATASLDTFLATPFSLNSIESWLLMLVGLLVGLGAFLKMFHNGEPYPGYARITRHFTHALDTYTDHLSEALESLEERRDLSVEALKEADEIVRENIGDAIDALYGHRLVRAHLQTFLSQCDIKVQRLLQLYRDANRAARTSEAPKHFDEAYLFPSFEDPEIEMGYREDARRELQAMRDILEGAIASIHDDYLKLKNRYPNPDEVIDFVLPTRGRLDEDGDNLPSSLTPSASRQRAPLRAVPEDRGAIIEGARSV